MNDQELVQIYQLLRRQEIRLSELSRVLAMAVQVLGDDPEFFAKFNQAPEARHISGPILKVIEDKLKSLAA